MWKKNLKSIFTTDFDKRVVEVEAEVGDGLVFRRVYDGALCQNNPTMALQKIQ